MSAVQPPPALELVIFAGDTIAIHRLPGAGTVRIGRGPGNDVSIEHGSVSRRHAVLHVGDELSVEDLGSANGVHVRAAGAGPAPGETENLKRLEGERVGIRVGDYLAFGAVAAVIRWGLSAEAAQRAAVSFVVRDPEMLGVFEQAALVAPSNLSVLVVGETGVGKELVARAVHERSNRSEGPFIAVNCGALTPTLLESELFGHERGAFTGANESRQGLIEAAEGGTLFLDEVGELPSDIQVKLLRVLEDGKLRRVGARREKHVDVRYVAATNRDLEQDVSRGKFRPDLYFRLTGMTLEVPPLRNRPADVEPLARAFAARAAEQLGREAPALAAETLAALRAYSWPGNVRELRNAVERGVVMARGSDLLPHHLPARIASGNGADAAPIPQPEPAQRAAPGPADLDGLRRQMSELERRRLLDALDRCSGNQTRAAELLGISRRTLVNRLNEFGTPRPRKKLSP